MKIKRTLSIAIVASITLSLIPGVAFSAQTVKAGATCKTLNQKISIQSKVYTCIKSGKKMIWNNGIAITKPTPISTAPKKSIDASKSVEGGACSPALVIDRVGYSRDLKKLVLLHCLKEGRWFDLGNIYKIVVNQITGEIEAGAAYANFPFRYKNHTESRILPTSSNVFTEGNIPIGECKISQNDPNGFHKGFNWTGSIRVKQNMILQVLPVQASDYSSTGNPGVDYKNFIDGIKEIIHNLSDGTWDLQVRVPATYLKLPASLASYKVGTDNSQGEARTPGQELLTRDALAAGNSLDLQGASLFMIVAPPTTPQKVFTRFSNSWSINLGPFPSVGSFSITPIDPAWGTIHHDFFHLGLGIPDHLGDEIHSAKDFTQFIGRTGEILGTDRWGNMSGTQMDWLAWDKWLSGLMQDSQVICAKVTSSANFWIKPSATYRASKKFLVIPTGPYTAIAVESIRNVGYNANLSTNILGALVYSVDLTKNEYGYGFNVIRPLNRLKDASIFPSPGNNTLRVGDSLIFGGYRISVIEAGDFGDVVKVEKLS